MASIPFSQAGQYRQLAHIRILLAFTGHTHQWLLDYADRAASILRRDYDNPADAPIVLSWLAGAWGEAFEGWKTGLESARRQAAALAFGELALMHRHFMSLGDGPSLQEAGPADFPPVYEPQLKAVLDAAAQRVHGDGFRLSQRIWRLDNDSFDGIKGTVMAGVSESKSAWQLAKDVEEYLGPHQNCPRWPSTRLFKLTKADIAAGDRRGLLKGPACTPERGVAYNALRLARTEISFAHNEATRAIHEASPWVEAVKVNLNPEHPEPDICDDFANGGSQGGGVYPQGDVVYPPYHPHCLCFVTSAQMSDEAFRQKMRGWLNRTGEWPAMDSYAGRVNRTRFDIGDLAVVAGLEETLCKWTFELGKYGQLRLFD